MCQARAVECNELKEPSTMEITTVGLDIAKRVFQLHGVDAAGKTVLRRKLQRSEVLAFFKALPPCLVGIEACGTTHYWAREIRELGHEVRLMPCVDQIQMSLILPFRWGHGPATDRGCGSGR